MKFVCQVIWIGLMAFGFFASLYWNINGRKAQAPAGFVGLLSTFVIYALSIALGFGAGVYQGFFQ